MQRREPKLAVDRVDRRADRQQCRRRPGLAVLARRVKRARALRRLAWDKKPTGFAQNSQVGPAI